MAFSKELLNKDGVSVVVSEDAGVAALTLSVGESLGGGQAAGVATLSGSLAAKVSALQLVDLGLELAAAKFPAAASLIAGVKAIVDAEAAKV